ncbi:MAG: hypothetical protein ACR2IA_08885 [Pyrinomonadaceae bacterium]
MDKQVIFGVSTFLLMIGVGIFALFNNPISFGGDGEGTYNIAETLKSPDENHTATLWFGMGGGAAGWCSKRVSIDTKESPFNLEKELEKGGYIFSVSCGSEVSLEWKNDTQLNISYTNQKFGVTTYQNPLSNDEKVKIFYELKQ